MATIRKGHRAVLLIVDVQVGVIEDAWEADRIVQNISRAVEKARSQNVPIVWVQHNGRSLKQDSPQWQIVPELSPRADEAIIQKNYNSSFEETNLEETLESLGAARIILAGAATNWCIRATAYAALERGYDLTLIADGHTTEDLEPENGPIIPAEHIIHDLNTIMDWVRYPGRENRVFRVDEIQFEAV
jgi:nicotinamidase-related amidase